MTEKLSSVNRNFQMPAPKIIVYLTHTHGCQKYRNRQRSHTVPRRKRNGQRIISFRDRYTRAFPNRLQDRQNLKMHVHCVLHFISYFVVK